MTKIYCQLMEEEHVEKRVLALNSFVVSDGIFIENPVTTERTLEWVRSIKRQATRKDFVFFLDENVAGFGGVVEIDFKHRRCELYVFLMPEFIGKGLGNELLKFLLTYAKCELNLRKITLFVSSGNVAAFSIYKKAGFQEEGVLKYHVWHRGKYVDRHILSIFLESLDLSSEYLRGIWR